MRRPSAPTRRRRCLTCAARCAGAFGKEPQGSRGLRSRSQRPRGPRHGWSSRARVQAFGTASIPFSGQGLDGCAPLPRSPRNCQQRLDIESEASASSPVAPRSTLPGAMIGATGKPVGLDSARPIACLLREAVSVTLRTLDCSSQKCTSLVRSLETTRSSSRLTRLCARIEPHANPRGVADASSKVYLIRLWPFMAWTGFLPTSRFARDSSATNTANHFSGAHE